MGFQHLDKDRIRALGAKGGVVNRKLSDDQVSAIRRASGISDQTFADDFGVSMQTITHARTGVTYKHVRTPPRRVYARRAKA